ncbi:MAG: Coq4 family protein [Microcoleaceae cyanobacterium]
MKIKEVHRHLLQSLMTLKGVISLIKNPNDTISVYDIEDALIYEKPHQVSMDFILSQPGIELMLEQQYLAPEPNVEQLLQCPKESLGYQYADYLNVSGFDPHFYRDLKITDHNSYLLMRRRQTHDIWHIITGFGADVASELGLKAFELAQTRSPMSAILVAGGLVRTLFETPEDLGYLLDRLAIGYRMGAKAQPFLAQKWEQHWEKSVEQWRSELNVEVPPVYLP